MQTPTNTTLRIHHRHHRNNGTSPLLFQPEGNTILRLFHQFQSELNETIAICETRKTRSTTETITTRKEKNNTKEQPNNHPTKHNTTREVLETHDRYH
ncbi:hypothetical protein D6783_03580 [Candidatus Woesearchaeota archaeon]|nr:MAG: hypothetical protein D6783_03580 [Candidatus Woesearchaeota archaeon]